MTTDRPEWERLREHGQQIADNPNLPDGLRDLGRSNVERADWELNDEK